MKFRVKLSPNTETVPFNYLHQLCGIFHYWVGPQDLVFHNDTSLYSIGGLIGGKGSKDGVGLDFPNGTYWDIGIWDQNVANAFAKGLLERAPVFYGMKIELVKELSFSQTESFKTRFWVSTPVILRKNLDSGGRQFLLWNDRESSTYLKRCIDRKLDVAGLSDLKSKYAIYFDQSFRSAKSKLIRIRQTNNKGSICPVIIVGPSEVAEFVWTVGVGEMTGSGFGSVNLKVSRKKRSAYAPHSNSELPKRMKENEKVA